MKKTGRSWYWPVLAGKFLAGQGVILTINLAVGFLFLRLLPKNEYALYISAGVLLAIISLGSDMGLTQAVNTLGARFRDDKERLGALLAGAYRYRKRFFMIAACVTMLVAFFMFRGDKWPILSITGVVPMVLVIGWFQCHVSLNKSILNMHHNAAALFYVGMWEASVRLVAVVLCVVWPTAITALTVSFFGVIASRMAVEKACGVFFLPGAIPNHMQNLELRKFIVPLIPVVVYYLLQGQVSIFLLNIYGYTSATAEVGALGRLGQVLGLLLMLNPFLLQPTFARIDMKSVFVHRVAMVVGGLLVFSVGCILSVLWAPHLWLYVLGPKYSGLTRELSLAIVGALFTIIGSALYTIVVSRNVTKGQTWAIIGGLGSQFVYIVVNGVHSVMDALTLNIVPLVTFAFLQLILVISIIKKWPPKSVIPYSPDLYIGPAI